MVAKKKKVANRKQIKPAKPVTPAFTMKASCDGCACSIINGAHGQELICELGYKIRRGIPEPGKITKLIPCKPCPKPETRDRIALFKKVAR